MANRRQPLIPHWLWPGLMAAGLILLIALAAMGSLWRHAPESDWRSLWQDSYLWHVVRFTFWQALLSAIISVGWGYSSCAYVLCLYLLMDKS